MKSRPDSFPTVRSPLSRHVFITAAFALALASPATWAVDQSSIQSEAYRNSVAQDTLRQDAASVQAELAAVRGEMKQFLPDDLALVDRVFTKLSSLSKNEMNKAVLSLRNASQAGDLKTQLASLVGAQNEQAAITKGLMKMSVDLNAKQSAAKLMDQIEEFMRSEARAASATARIAAKNPLPSELKDKTKTQYDLLLTDQELLSSGIKTLADRMEVVAKNLPEGPSRISLAKISAISAQKQLGTSAVNALALVQNGPLDQAGGTQKNIVNTLASMLEVLKAEKSSIGDRLKQMAEEIRQIGNGQSEIAESKELKANPNPLIDRQNQLADRIAELSPQVKNLNSRAAEALTEAQAEMETARKMMGGRVEDHPAARAAVTAAAEKLNAALAAVEGQIAQVEKAPDTVAELAAQLAQLQTATAQTAQEQNRQANATQDPASPLSPTAKTNPASPLAQNPASPSSPSSPSAAQKEALQNKVEKIQEAAAAISPDAAKTLGEAAAQMSQPDAASQKEATQSLVKASQELAQQLAALKGQTAAQQAMAKAESQVNAASQSVAQAQSDVAPGSGKSAEAANQLAEAGKQVAAAQQAAAANGVPQDAKSALAEAQNAIGQAQMSAAQTKTAAAQAQAAAAQKALGEAKAALASASQAMAAQAAAAMAANSKGENSADKSAQSLGEKNPATQPATKFAANAGSSSSDSGSDQGSMDGGEGDAAGEISSAGATGPSTQVVTGLSPKDRDAVAILQTEKPPGEFVPEVNQYYKNLADGVGL